MATASLDTLLEESHKELEILLQCLRSDGLLPVVDTAGQWQSMDGTQRGLQIAVQLAYGLLAPLAPNAEGAARRRELVEDARYAEPTRKNETPQMLLAAESIWVKILGWSRETFNNLNLGHMVHLHKALSTAMNTKRRKNHIIHKRVKISSEQDTDIIKTSNSQTQVHHAFQAYIDVKRHLELGTLTQEVQQTAGDTFAIELKDGVMAGFLDIATSIHKLQAQAEQSRQKTNKKQPVITPKMLSALRACRQNSLQAAVLDKALEEAGCIKAPLGFVAPAAKVVAKAQAVAIISGSGRTGRPRVRNTAPASAAGQQAGGKENLQPGAQQDKQQQSLGQQADVQQEDAPAEGGVLSQQQQAKGRKPRAGQTKGRKQQDKEEAEKEDELLQELAADDDDGGHDEQEQEGKEGNSSALDNMRAGSGSGHNSTTVLYISDDEEDVPDLISKRTGAHLLRCNTAAPPEQYAWPPVKLGNACGDGFSFQPAAEQEEQQQQEEEELNHKADRAPTSPTSPTAAAAATAAAASGSPIGGVVIPHPALDASGPESAATPQRQAEAGPAPAPTHAAPTQLLNIDPYMTPPTVIYGKMVQAEQEEETSDDEDYEALRAALRGGLNPLRPCSFD